MSGEAVAYENHSEVLRVSLSPNQLQALSRWLDQHRQGWSAHITEPSSEPTALSVRVIRADETTNDLAIAISLDEQTNLTSSGAEPATGLSPDSPLSRPSAAITSGGP